MEIGKNTRFNLVSTLDGDIRRFSISSAKLTERQLLLMQERRTSERRIATMNEDRGGKPLGVGVFLTPEQLAQLGIDPEETDVVEYYVENGEMQVRSGIE